MEKNSLCIDTDIIIDFTKNREPGASAFEYSLSRNECFITAISAHELYFGAENRGTKHARELDMLLSSLKILSFDTKSAKISAAIDVKLQKMGNKLPIKDILIASICLSNNLPLLTQNISHFSRISNLRVFTPKDILSEI